MKIQELIDELNKVPEERRDEEATIYVNGRLTGILAIDRIEPNFRCSDDSLKLFIHTASPWEYEK